MISSTYRDTFGEGKFISWLLRRKHGTDSSNSGRFSCKVPLQQFTVTVEIVGIMEIKIPEMLLASLRVQFKPCTYSVVYIQPAKKNARTDRGRSAFSASVRRRHRAVFAMHLSREE